jgi:hypothetical protein
MPHLLLCPSYAHPAHAPEHHPCVRMGPMVGCIILQQSERASSSTGLHPMPSSFTPAAQILWDAIPLHFQERILQNVSCPHCGDMTTMTDFTGEVHGRSLVLRETCVTCRGKVARVLGGASENSVGLLLCASCAGGNWSRADGVLYDASRTAIAFI